MNINRIIAKKTLMLFFLVVLLFMQSISFTSVEATTPSAITTPIDTRKFDPLVGLEHNFSRPVLPAGREVILSLPIIINANHTARDVEVTLEFDKELQPYLDFKDARLIRRIDRIRVGRTEDVEFAFRINSLAAAGNYTLKINYRYLNSFKDVFTSSETIQIKVTNTRTPPELIIKDMGISTPEARRGEVVTLYILLENMGTMPADDVVVHLMGQNNNELRLFNSTNERRLKRITGKRTGKVYYDLMVAANARSSILQFDVRVSYRDHGNNKYLLETPGFVQLDLAGVANDKPVVIIENLQVPEQAVDTQENFAITFDIKNTAAIDAQNLKITIGTGGDIIPKSLDTIIHPRLAAGETKSITFLLSTTADAASKNYAIPINIEYEEMIGNESIKHSATQYVGVNIGGNELGQTVPKIIIDKFTVGEEKIKAEIKAGEEFDLTLSFFNTNKLLSVRNIKATITSADGSFTPVKGSNMFFIDYIAAGGRVERSIRLFPKVDLVSKSYPLTIKLEYEDELGLRGEARQVQQHTADIEISLPVIQEPRLKIDNLEIPPVASMGMPIFIYADFYNMGRSTLNNLLVRVEGDFEGEALSFFVGNFAPGASDFFEASIMPLAVGEQKGSLIFAFEDDMGRSIEVREDFTVMVTEMQAGDINIGEGEFPIRPNGELYPGGNGEGPGLNKVAISALVLVVLVITAVVVRKIRKKRRLAREEGLMLDE